MHMRHSFWLAAAVTAVLVFAVRPADASTNKTISTIATSGGSSDVVVVGSYAYVAEGASGVGLYNVSTPSSPSFVGYVTLSDIPSHVVIDSPTMYVATASAVDLFSLANPASPSPYASPITPAHSLQAYDVATNGTTIYVVAGDSTNVELQKYDVSNKNAPSFTSSVALISGATHPAAYMTFSGSYAYVTCGSQLFVVDVASMAVVGSVNQSGTTLRGVEVFGSNAYVNGNGLHAFSIANPAAPTLSFDGTDATHTGYGVAVSNGYVFLSRDNGELVIYDIATTGSPVYVDTLAGGTYGGGVTIANDVAYVANGSVLQLFDVSQPDTIPPVVTPNGGESGGSGTIVITPGKTFTDPGVTVTDNVGVNSSWTTVSGSVNTSKVGRYVLTYTTTDRAGNVTVTQRVVYVAPTISSVKTSSNTLKIKVGKKYVTLRPFPGYYGGMVAKKLILDTTKNPYYMFLSTATRYPKMVIYDANGKIKWRADFRGVSSNGLLVQMAANPVSTSVYLSLAPTSGAMKVSIYNIAKSGVKLLKSFTAKGGRGTLVMAFLKISDTEYALATKPKNTNTVPYVWRYKGGSTKWYRDTTFPTTRLLFGKTYIKLRY